METLGDYGEPPESNLDVTGVVHAERQQESSPPVTSDEPFPPLLDESGMVDGDVGFGVVVRSEPSVTDKFGGSGVLGIGKQQQPRPLQQPSSSGSGSSSSDGLGGAPQTWCRGGVSNRGW